MLRPGVLRAAVNDFSQLFLMQGLFSSLTSRFRSSDVYGALSLLSAAGATALYLSDRAQQSTRAQLNAEFDAKLASAQLRAKEEKDAKVKSLKNAPTLWSGVLLQSDARLRGHAMFQGKAGMAVDVLEEGVGDDGKYVTVRSAEDGSQVGWFLRDWVGKAR